MYSFYGSPLSVISGGLITALSMVESLFALFSNMASAMTAEGLLPLHCNDSLLSMFSAIKIWILTLLCVTRPQLRNSQWRLMMASTIIAVAAVSGVGFLVSRIQAVIEHDASAVLGGDLQLRSSRVFPQELQSIAEALGGRVLQTVIFTSMAASKTDTRLVAIKAVEGAYPLRGSLLIRNTQTGQAREAHVSDLNKGEVWLDEQVLSILALDVGAKVRLGDSELRIAGVIDYESDRDVGFAAFSPRVLMRMDDLAATGLLSALGRYTYRMMVAFADKGKVATAEAQYKTFIEQNSNLGIRIASIDNVNQGIGSALDRAILFLRLVALVAATLAGVAVALSARLFANSQLDAAALMRVMGLTQAEIIKRHTQTLLVGGLAAGVIGACLGYIAHVILLNFLSVLIARELPPAQWWPLLLALSIAWLTLLAFAWPPLLRIAHVPAMRVLRKELAPHRHQTWIALGVALIGIVGMMLLVARHIELGSFVILGVAALLSLSFALTRIVLWGMQRLLGKRAVLSVFPFALRAVVMRKRANLINITALSIGMFSLLLLILVRTDLLKSWRDLNPEDRPNRFVLNIQPNQEQSFREATQQLGAPVIDWFPIVRGRLIAVNGQKPKVSTNEMSDNVLAREINLTFDRKFPSNNRLLEGQWHGQSETGLSVDQGFAQSIHAKLGDELTFDVGGNPIKQNITSIREVDWSSMRANFYAIYAEPVLQNLPRWYIATMLVNAGNRNYDLSIVKQFPNISIINITLTLAQVNQILDQVIQAIELVFIFALVAGLLVLYSALVASRVERVQELALLRSMGASRSWLQQRLVIELVLIGVIAGVLAACGALVTTKVLSEQVFNFHWEMSFSIIPLGGLGGALLTCLVGLWGLRGIVHTPPVVVLRQA